MAAAQTESNFFFDHPGFVGVIFAIAVAGAFIGAIYVNVSGHHEEGHSGAEQGAEHAPEGAPAH